MWQNVIKLFTWTLLPHLILLQMSECKKPSEFQKKSPLWLVVCANISFLVLVMYSMMSPFEEPSWRKQRISLYHFCNFWHIYNSFKIKFLKKYSEKSWTIFWFICCVTVSSRGSLRNTGQQGWVTYGTRLWEKREFMVGPKHRPGKGLDAREVA